MALFRFYCPTCESEVKRLLTPEQAKGEVKCKKDGATLIRTPTESATTVFETIDNGIMPRKVTQIAGAPDLIQERHDQHLRDINKKTLV